MTTVCIVAFAFVTYKLLEEEHSLLKAGDQISQRQWLMFRMAKLSARNLIVFATGVLLFVDKYPLACVLAAPLFAYFLIQYGARILHRILSAHYRKTFQQ